MAVKIARGDRAHCLSSLATENADYTEYPLRTYEELTVFEVAGQGLRTIQGVNPVPQPRFLVALADEAAKHAGLEAPGVLPFLVSSFQVSGHKRDCIPKPTQVGIPLLTTEQDYLIRWMLAPDGEHNQ